MKGELKHMKSFLEDLGRKIGETAETVTNKAGEAVEVQRLRNQIRALERGNERDYAELGRMVYDLFKSGEAVADEAAVICEAIQNREESIGNYEQQISEVKGDVTCEGCGKSVGKEMAYCPYCGAKTPERNGGESTDYAGAVKEKVADMAEKVKETAENTADMVREKVDAAAEILHETAADSADTMKDKTEDAADVVKEKAADAADLVKEKTVDAADTVKEKTAYAADAVKEKTADAMDALKDRTEDAADAAKDKAADVVESVKEMASEVQEKVKSMTEE